MPIKQGANCRVQTGTNFTAAHTGPLSSLSEVKLEVPHLNRTVNGKMFLREMVGMTGMQISMNKLPAGAGTPFLHAHQDNEETYIIIAGKGQMQIDGQTFDVEEGSVVRIGTKGYRAIRNNGSADLHFICIQAKEGSLRQETFEDGVKSDQTLVWPN